MLEGYWRASGGIGGILEGLRRDWRDVGGPPEGLEGLVEGSEGSQRNGGISKMDIDLL